MSGSWAAPHPTPPTPSHLEQSDDAIVTPAPGIIQCRVTKVVLRLSVRAALEKQRDDRLVTIVRRVHEGRHAEQLQRGSTGKG